MLIDVTVTYLYCAQIEVPDDYLDDQIYSALTNVRLPSKLEECYFESVAGEFTRPYAESADIVTAHYSENE